MDNPLGALHQVGKQFWNAENVPHVLYFWQHGNRDVFPCFSGLRQFKAHLRDIFDDCRRDDDRIHVLEVQQDEENIRHVYCGIRGEQPLYMSRVFGFYRVKEMASGLRRLEPVGVKPFRQQRGRQRIHQERRNREQSQESEPERRGPTPACEPVRPLWRGFKRGRLRR